MDSWSEIKSALCSRKLSAKSKSSLVLRARRASLEKINPVMWPLPSASVGFRDDSLPISRFEVWIRRKTWRVFHGVQGFRRAPGLRWKPESRFRRICLFFSIANFDSIS